MRARLSDLSRPLGSLALLAGALAGFAAAPAIAGNRSTWITDSNGFGWGVIESENETTCSGTGRSDWLEIRELSRSEDAPVFWFRLEGKSYVVRDAKVVGEARDLTQPLRELGDLQSALGERQSALGDQQSKLGDRQSRLGSRQAALSERLTRLAYAAARDQEDRASARERDRVQDEISELSDEQSELGREQSKLGVQQSKLGREQARLGAQQAEFSREIEPKLRRLAETARKDGTAEPYSR